MQNPSLLITTMNAKGWTRKRLANSGSGGKGWNLIMCGNISRLEYFRVNLISSFICCYGSISINKFRPIDSRYRCEYTIFVPSARDNIRFPLNSLVAHPLLILLKNYRRARVLINTDLFTG
jgi:hypothetical protein